VTDDLARLRRELPAWRVEWDPARAVLIAVKQYGKRRGRHIEAPTEVDLRRQIRVIQRGTDIPPAGKGPRAAG